MNNELRQEIIDLIKENLEVKVYKHYGYGSDGVEVRILFEGEVISEDYATLNYTNDY